jgi:CheY-like chemotaxis protein
LLVDDAAVYGLTDRAELQLRSGLTTLDAQDLALLIRFDGTLTVAELRGSLDVCAQPAFPEILRRFQREGLLQRVAVDPFTLHLKQEVKNLASCTGSEQADAGLSSLQRTGFFVEIAQARRPQQPRTGTGPLDVVLVEDDPMLAKFTRSYLALNGMTVRLAANRAEVLAEIRRPPRPDLFLLDVMLPDVDGFRLLQRIREHPVLRSVPVIMLTGKATREAVLRGLAGGADGYLTKPFQPDTLMRAVHTVLGSEPPLARAGDDRWANGDALERRGVAAR